MSYYLDFSTGGTVVFTPVNLNVDWWWEIEVEVSDTNNQRLLNFNNNGFRYLRADSGFWELRNNLSGLPNTVSTTPVSVGVKTTIRIEAINSDVYWFIEGEPQGLIGTQTNDFIPNDLNYASLFTGKVYRYEIGSNGVLIHNWVKTSLSGDPDTSFTDTVGSNSGVLTDFPPNNSHWVYYDDGSSPPVEYTITLDSGSYTLAGNSLTLLSNRTLSLDNGSYLLTGTDLNLAVQRHINLSEGIYAKQGTNTNLLLERLLGLETGDYTKVGNPSELLADRLLPLEEGSYGYLGEDINFTSSAAPSGDLYYLNFATGDYVSFSPLVSDLGGGYSWDIEFRAANNTSDEFIVLGESGNVENFIIIRNDNTIDYKVDSAQKPYPITDKSSETAVYRFEARGGLISLYENDIFKGSHTFNDVNVGGLLDSGFSQIGNARGDITRSGALYYLKYTDNNNPANDRFFNPSASNGTGQILPDTVGGSDGALVNFPTDDSQWIQYEGDPSSLNYTIILSEGTYTSVGTSQNFVFDRRLLLIDGTYSLQGTETGILKDYILPLGTNSYSYTPENISLLADRKINTESGSYSYVGTPINFIYEAGGITYTLSIDSGDYSLTGQSLKLLVNRKLPIDFGEYTYEGVNSELLYNRVVALGSGIYSSAGTDLGVKVNRRLVFQNGNYSLQGTPITLSYSGEVLAILEGYNLSYKKHPVQSNYKTYNITARYN